MFIGNPLKGFLAFIMFVRENSTSCIEGANSYTAITKHIAIGIYKKSEIEDYPAVGQALPFITEDDTIKVNAPVIKVITQET